MIPIAFIFEQPMSEDSSEERRHVFLTQLTGGPEELENPQTFDEVAQEAIAAIQGAIEMASAWKSHVAWPGHQSMRLAADLKSGPGIPKIMRVATDSNPEIMDWNASTTWVQESLKPALENAFDAQVVSFEDFFAMNSHNPRFHNAFLSWEAWFFGKLAYVHEPQLLLDALAATTTNSPMAVEKKKAARAKL